MKKLLYPLMLLVLALSVAGCASSPETEEPAEDGQIEYVQPEPATWQEEAAQAEPATWQEEAAQAEAAEEETAQAEAAEEEAAQAEAAWEEAAQAEAAGEEAGREPQQRAARPQREPRQAAPRAATPSRRREPRQAAPRTAAAPQRRAGRQQPADALAEAEAAQQPADALAEAEAAQQPADALAVSEAAGGAQAAEAAQVSEGARQPPGGELPQPQVSPELLADASDLQDRIAAARMEAEQAGAQAHFPEQLAEADLAVQRMHDLFNGGETDAAFAEANKAIAMYETIKASIDILSLREQIIASGSDSLDPEALAEAEAKFIEASEKARQDHEQARQLVLDALAAYQAVYARELGQPAEVAEAAQPAGAAPLPASYRVETWGSVRDCFWNIAGKPAVYGDPLQWRVLYEANRDILTDPDNPDLILPDTIIQIPSIRGEHREGIYDPAVNYGSVSDR